MMRSMYTGVSGLRTHQEKMDTIGNNIANVNTTGFKRGQVTFKDTFSQMITGASGPQGGRGGTNPQQIGMGVTTGAIKTIHTVGNGQATGDPLDLMLEGDGFFTVSNDVGFNNRFYTRNGSFATDALGNIVTSDGMKVLGYMADKDGNIDQSTITGLRVNQSDTVPAMASNNIQFRGNLDSNTPVNESITVDNNIYDSLGNQYKISYEVKKTDANKWEISVDRVTDMGSGNYVEAEYGENGELINKDNLPQFTKSGTDNKDGKITLEFDKSGELIKINGGEVSGDTKFAKVSLDLSEDNLIFNKDKNGEKLDTEVSPAGKFGEGGLVSIFDSENADTYNRIKQYANETDFKPHRQDGNTSGTLTGFNFNANGELTGVFSNGDRKVLGQLLITKFDNPMGLEKVGNTMFVESRNSGEPQLGVANTGGRGGIKGGTLEMSNVDISFEFTEMITTQRGFQANSRIITTSDEMLQELVNIKR